MTAYEMRISDWSSDVCSSDLAEPSTEPAPGAAPVEPARAQPAAPDLAPATDQTTATTDASASPAEAVASPISAAVASDAADDAGADTNADGAGIHALDEAQRTESTSHVAAPDEPAELAGDWALERTPAMQPEIGNESRRARGCQYVKILGGDVHKKK